MITTERYFIHVDNKSVVPWTSEIAENYKFKEITVKVAMAIERGTISADEVVEQITRQVKPGTLEQMLDAKLKMNVREGALNLEEQVKADNTQKDTGTPKPFDIALPEGGDKPEGGGKPEGGDKPKNQGKTQRGSSKKNQDKPDGKAAEKTADEQAEDEAAKVAAALDGDQGGVVNV